MTLCPKCGAAHLSTRVCGCEITMNDALFDVSKKLGEVEYRRDEYKRALEQIHQRTNESGTGTIGLIDTINAVYFIADRVLKKSPADRGTP